MRFKYFNTLIYIAAIVVINAAFSITPIYTIFDCELSAMDPIAGIIYLLRDFAQAELGHFIFIAMGIGAAISLALADPVIAKASVYAFLTGEIIDWAIYTYTRRPLSERLLWSSGISAPIDSLVFLIFINRLNLLSLVIMTIGKIIGILVIWRFWKARNEAKPLC